MTRTILLTLISSATLLFASCDSTSPEKNFDVAVLNCNLITGFANGGFERELSSPTVKLVEGTGGKTVPMMRSEIVEEKIRFIENNLDRVKGFTETEDNKDILHHSIALHEYVLPVFKSEYKELARLYDIGAPTERIENEIRLIEEKYFPDFEKLYASLTAAGKTFAAKHNINVHWRE